MPHWPHVPLCPLRGKHSKTTAPLLSGFYSFSADLQQTCPQYKGVCKSACGGINILKYRGRCAPKKGGGTAGAHLGAAVKADAGSSATFCSTATKKPPVSPWWGSRRMQRSRCRLLKSPSANMLLHSFACACAHVTAHVSDVIFGMAAMRPWMMLLLTSCSPHRTLI